MDEDQHLHSSTSASIAVTSDVSLALSVDNSMVENVAPQHVLEVQLPKILL